MVSPEGVDARVRPNQLLAVSLPIPCSAGAGASGGAQGLAGALRHLRDPSLSPADGDYRGIYTGDRFQRDGAYHQGTAWGWLMGPFITAIRRVHGYLARPAGKLP